MLIQIKRLHDVLVRPHYGLRTLWPVLVRPHCGLRTLWSVLVRPHCGLRTLWPVLVRPHYGLRTLWPVLVRPHYGLRTLWPVLVRPHYGLRTLWPVHYGLSPFRLCSYRPSVCRYNYVVVYVWATRTLHDCTANVLSRCKVLLIQMMVNFVLQL